MTQTLQPSELKPTRRQKSASPMVSVVVPIYNEEDNVIPLLKELVQVGESLQRPYELILVDDGSSDNTLNLLHQLVQELPDTLRVVSLRRNYGQTAAMAAGFEVARGEITVTLDGDLQNDPHDIPALITHLLEHNLDMVVGWRQNRQDSVLSRKIPSWIANRMIAKMTGVNFKDYGCSLKVYKTELAKEMPLYGELHRFIPVLASMDGARIAQLPVNHRARIYGKSKYNLSRTFKVVLDLGMLLFLKKFMSRPLHLFGRLGFLSIGTGSIMLAYLTVEKLAFHLNIGSRPLLMLGVLLVILGIQFISTGLLAELQIRTYFESQGKTPYKIRSVSS
jgi:glycosyltransferase involved in cell wall biosynthesis